MSGFHKLHSLQHAARCRSQSMPRPQSAPAKAGLAYQRKITRVLKPIAESNGFALEADPWFTFTDTSGGGHAVPDIVLTAENCVLIIEVKLTFVTGAQEKLLELYSPVIRKALNLTFYPRCLVICKHLVPGRLASVESISNALKSAPGSAPVLQWLGHGGIQW